MAGQEGEGQTSNENYDDVEDHLEDLEVLADRLWEVALSAAGTHWDEFDRRDTIPPPEEALARILIDCSPSRNLEQQKQALEYAAEYGEEMIRKAEVELAEMRRALAALRQPRSTLLRSRMKLAVVPDASANCSDRITCPEPQDRQHD